MSARLQLKHGLVAEQDRLSTSADSLLVSEPSTGSKSRTKGNLYVLVSSAAAGGRARDAAAVVAQTIQREYYYDESAGIPILLEKCFRSANRKLRGREGGGIQQGSIGIACAVIRGNELYVATVGSVDAYLVRAARLLVPERTAAPGIPAADLRVDVWRGELSVGDSVLLVSRRLTEAVGTEELKNAVVTLHPQSAVEHLHHLFVASGGEGSDAVLVVEATDLYARGNGRGPAVMPSGDAFGELAAGSQAEVAASGPRTAKGAVLSSGRGILGGITAAIGDAVERLIDLVPHRRTSVRRITPQVSRREAQRRGAIALLAFLAVLLFVGVAVALFPHGKENNVQPVTDAQAFFNSAKDKTDSVLAVDGTTTVEATRATRLLREAYADLKKAEDMGVTAESAAPLRSRIEVGLNLLYNVHHAAASVLAAFPAGAKPTALEHGPLGQDQRALYYIDEAAGTVSRVDPASKAAPKVVVRAGDGIGDGIGQPRFLVAGGLDLLIIDVRGNLWSWRPSNTKGDGTLRRLQVRGEQVWGNGVTDVATYPSDNARYGLYVALPSAKQILKYSQFGDGSALSPPTNWLTSTSEDVSQFIDMTIDFNMYTIAAAPGSCDIACRGEKLLQHNAGNLLSYSIDPLPDETDMRPGHDFQLITNAGDKSVGRLYLYDAKHGRVVVYSKTGGAYLEQWLPLRSGAPMKDVSGILVVPPDEAKPTDPTMLYWLTPSGLMASPLVNVVESPLASQAPSASSQPSLEPLPSRTPRRTPKP
jgi:hypothetical protein